MKLQKSIQRIAGDKLLYNLLRLALLHQLVPHATVVGQLLDENFQDSVSHIKDVQKGARALGLQLIVMKARTAADIDSAFNSLSEQGVHAVVTGPGGLTFSRREQIVALAAKYEIPAMFPFGSLRRKAA